MKKPQNSENELTQALRRWLMRRGFLVLPEVRVQPHSIDLVAFKPSSLSLSAVEVKLRDWRKALRQSTINRAFVDLSYVAVPERLAEKIAKELHPDVGIGILSFRITSDRIFVRLVKEAVNDVRPNKHFRRYVIAKLVKRYGERLVK